MATNKKLMNDSTDASMINIEHADVSCGEDLVNFY